MTSLMTNTSAMVALQTLRGINSNLDTTSERISSGLKIGAASDNAAYWSIATTMKSDDSSLGAVTDSLNLGASIAKTAYNGLDQAKDLLSKIKDKLTTAAGDGVDRVAIQGEISALQDQLKTVASTSSFSGQNWLSGAAGETKNIVSSVSRDGNNKLSVSSISVSTTDIRLVGGTGATAGILEKDRSVTGYLATAATSTLADATFDADDAVTFTITPNGGAAKVVTINQATVNSALYGDNTIATKADLKAVYEKAFENAGLTGFSVNVSNTGEVSFGSTSDFAITGAALSDVNTSAGVDLISLGLATAAPTKTTPATTANVLGLDISAVTDTNVVQSYLKIVDEAFNVVAKAASSVGAVQTRIDTQKELVSSLSDTLKTGVGSLIDANMEEESTRLKALQTQQQLAVQSLSIANSSSQTVLSLFR